MRRVAGFLVLTAILFAFSASAVPLRILFTNDLHLRFARLNDLAARIDEARAAAPGAVLLLDAGDAWQDYRRPVLAVWGAEEMVGWMNRVGYDAMAIGNHELYWSPDRVRRLSAEATFAVLCANLIPEAGYGAPFVPSRLLETEGVRVLVIGAVTRELLPYHDWPWLRVVDPAHAIRREIERYGSEVDWIVALVHLSTASAARLAESVPGVDIWATGHSHEATPAPIRAGDALIVQAGSFAQALGVLDVDRTMRQEPAEILSYALVPTKEETSPLAQRGLLRLLIVGSALAAVAAVMLL